MYCLTETSHFGRWTPLVKSVLDWVDPADELEEEHEVRNCESMLLTGIIEEEIEDDQLSSSTKTLLGSDRMPKRCLAEFILIWLIAWARQTCVPFSQANKSRSTGIWAHFQWLNIYTIRAVKLIRFHKIQGILAARVFAWNCSEITGQ